MTAPSGTRLAVLGSPIAHSKSPALHRAAYAVLGLDWEYGVHEVTDDGLRAFLDGLDDDWRGLSLTMPLKREALALSDEADEDARLTEAVNTIVLSRADGRTTRLGLNTDVGGIVRAVHAAGTTSVSRVRVLGGGATAGSAIAAAARLGAGRVDIVVRTPARAAGAVLLAQRLGLEHSVASFSDAPVGTAADVVISTLPGGVDAPERYSRETRERALLLDVAYAPWPSDLARHWHEAGGRVTGGLSMLVHQALLQVRAFRSGDPSAPLEREDAVLAAMLDAVGLPADGLS